MELTSGLMIKMAILTISIMFLTNLCRTYDKGIPIKYCFKSFYYVFTKLLTNKMLFKVAVTNWYKYLSICDDLIKVEIEIKRRLKCK